MDTASILIPIRDKILQTLSYLHVVICIVTECTNNKVIYETQPSFNHIDIGNYIFRRQSCYLDGVITTASETHCGEEQRVRSELVYRE